MSVCLNQSKGSFSVGAKKINSLSPAYVRFFCFCSVATVSFNLITETHFKSEICSGQAVTWPARGRRTRRGWGRATARGAVLINYSGGWHHVGRGRGEGVTVLFWFLPKKSFFPSACQLSSMSRHRKSIHGKYFLLKCLIVSTLLWHTKLKLLRARAFSRVVKLLGTFLIGIFIFVRLNRHWDNLFTSRSLLNALTFCCIPTLL